MFDLLKIEKTPGLMTYLTTLPSPYSAAQTGHFLFTEQRSAGFLTDEGGTENFQGQMNQRAKIGTRCELSAEPNGLTAFSRLGKRATTRSGSEMNMSKMQIHGVVGNLLQLPLVIEGTRT